jgi:hypothetical protein
MPASSATAIARAARKLWASQSGSDSARNTMPVLAAAPAALWHPTHWTARNGVHSVWRNHWTSASQRGPWGTAASGV